MLIFRRWDDYFSVFCAVEVTKWCVRIQKAGSHSEVAARCGADVRAGGAACRVERGGADLILSVDFTWGGYSDEKRRKSNLTATGCQIEDAPPFHSVLVPLFAFDASG